ncbi:MAG: serine hydrolase [Pseudomonadota bacterium]
MKLFFASALLAAAAHAGAAPPLDPAVANMARVRVANGIVPGILIGTIINKERQVSAFGVVSRAAPRVPDADTVYEIGSVSKTFTALLLSDAAARGQLKLDDPVGKLLPAYLVPHYRGQAISLLDLATQTSALPRLPSNLLPKRIDNPYADYGDPDLKLFLAGYTLPRAPGARYEYSNLGYGLLGHALAAQAGMPYGELVRQRIVAPLGMQATGIALTPAMQARLAPGHNAQGAQVANWDFGALAGAGALRSSTNDMLAYLQAHMLAQPDAASAPRGLHAVRLARRDSSMPGTAIGLAWHVQTVRGRPVVWHNGMTGGYASFIGFTADGERGVVVLANAAVSVDDIGMSALVPQAQAAAADAPAPRLSAAALAQYVGRYRLAPNFTMTISANADGLLAQATGQAAAPLFARQADEFFYKVVEASLRFSRGADGKVNALTLHQGGHASPAPRIDDAAPAAPQRVEVPLSAELMREYVGSYALAPGFNLVITLDAGQLYAQATGQGRNALFASAKDALFLKVVDAQLRIERGRNGAVIGLVLDQNGAQVPARRNGD